MKKILWFSLGLLLIAETLPAKTVADVELPETVTVGAETLQLNGYGLRKKFFFKIYLGSLYTPSKAASTEEVLHQPGSKLIRMNFIYSKVDREKITDAFADGFANNSPQLQSDPAVENFLRLFSKDFVAGDQVDLILGADGTVSATHNSKELGNVKSKALTGAVLLIYLGERPADEDMKHGMLGQF